MESEDVTVFLSNGDIGSDLDMRDLAICSDGKKYQNIHKIQKVKKREKGNADYSVECSRVMRKIKKKGIL